MINFGKKVYKNKQFMNISIGAAELCVPFLLSFTMLLLCKL
jgi:hypothetical protein